MRIEALFLLGVAAFFGVVGIVYWFWAYDGRRGRDHDAHRHHAAGVRAGELLPVVVAPDEAARPRTVPTPRSVTGPV